MSAFKTIPDSDDAMAMVNFVITVLCFVSNLALDLHTVFFVLLK